MTSAAFTTAVFPTIHSAGSERELAAARQRGHAAGYAEGVRRAEAESAVSEERRRAEALVERERGAAQLTAARAVLASAVAALQAQALPTIDTIENTLVDATLELAEAVLGMELQNGETSARAALARAVSHPDSTVAVSIRLHPADLELLGAVDATDLGVPLVADATLSSGDAVVELPVGVLDARIGSALERARLALGGSAR